MRILNTKNNWKIFTHLNINHATNCRRKNKMMRETNENLHQAVKLQDKLMTK